MELPPGRDLDVRLGRRASATWRQQAKPAALPPRSVRPAPVLPRSWGKPARRAGPPSPPPAPFPGCSRAPAAPQAAAECMAHPAGVVEIADAWNRCVLGHESQASHGLSPLQVDTPACWPQHRDIRLSSARQSQGCWGSCRRREAPTLSVSEPSNPARTVTGRSSAASASGRSRRFFNTTSPL